MFSLFKKVKTLRSNVMSTSILIKANVDKKILKECLALAVDLEEKLSVYKPNSYISKVNKLAGLEAVECPSEVIEVVKLAKQVATETDGKFDPTIGVLTQGIYKFGYPEENLPEISSLIKAKENVNYKDIEVSSNYIFLKKRGMAIDLGGIGKGYASEKLALFLKEKGASCGLVSIGGEICCFGKPWNVAIKHPRKNSFLSVITTKDIDTTISTSGDYERYIKSTDYHHIIDTKTGRQNNYYSSITLISSGLQGGRLDAMATALFNTPSVFTKKWDFGILLADKNAQTVSLNTEIFTYVDNLKLTG